MKIVHRLPGSTRSQTRSPTSIPVSAGRIVAAAPALVVAMLLSGGANAQSSADTARKDAALACEDAAELLRNDDLDGALEEARWCLDSLQQLRQDQTLAIFPDAVDGWSGGELDQQGAMGMTMLSRSYSGDAGSIEVTLTSGAAGAGLAAIAQMGMAMGSGSGRKLRVQKRTVLDMSEQDESSANFLVQLRSGGMLTAESATVARQAVLDFLEAFPIADIDDALKR